MPKLHNARAVAFRLLRRPQTLTGFAFLAVGASIATNALFLQAHRHPSPFFSSGEPRNAGEPDEMVRAVQDALKQVGYYSGALDGIFGPQTKSAIDAFRSQSGYAGTGEPSPELLAAIRSTRRPDLSPVATEVVAPPAQPEAAPPPAASDPMVASIQEALSRAAYGQLVADGIAGPDTRNAIERFQRDHNLPVTGEISDALVVELRASGALGGN